MVGRAWIAAGMALGGGLCLTALFVLRAPRLPVSAANGTYSNDCCGDLILRDGALILGEKSIGYAVVQDGAKFFILPRLYVGTWEQRGFQIDGSRPALRLRIDHFPYPTAIRLDDLRTSFVFRRRPPLAG